MFSLTELGGIRGFLRRRSFDARWKWRLIAPDALEPSLGAHSVRRNPPPLPPDVACPPFIRRAASNLRAPSSSEPMRSVLLSSFGRVTRVYGRIDWHPLNAVRAFEFMWSDGGSVRRTLMRHGWRMRSAQGWLERVRRTEAPSLDRLLEVADQPINSAAAPTARGNNTSSRPAMRRRCPRQYRPVPSAAP